MKNTLILIQMYGENGKLTPENASIVNSVVGALYRSITNMVGLATLLTASFQFSASKNLMATSSEGAQKMINKTKEDVSTALTEILLKMGCGLPDARAAAEIFKEELADIELRELA